jgi:hypothetical protein
MLFRREVVIPCEPAEHVGMVLNLQERDAKIADKT